MYKTIIFLFSLFYNCVSIAQNVGIGTVTPLAALEVKSSNNGFLPPRLTIAQRDLITNPAVGLVIFCIDCDELEVSNGFVWKNMNGAAACVTSTLPFIKICDQYWMPSNLNVKNYRNGDNIPQVTDPAVWSNLTIGAWCWYNNDSATYAATYGRLYNWYAVNDIRGLAPIGWHIATDSEWTTLSTCLGGNAIAGGKMKATTNSFWNSPNTDATNSSGFTALPGGYCYLLGQFVHLGNYGFFWSATASDANNAHLVRLPYNFGILNRLIYDNHYGLSIRCVRD